MSVKRHCDWAAEDGVLCDDEAPIEASVSFEGRTYRTDLCKLHGQALVNAGEAVSMPASRVTRLPTVMPNDGRKSENLVEKVDFPDMRAWLQGQGLVKPGSKGRISAENQQKWIDAGSPRPI